MQQKISSKDKNLITIPPFLQISTDNLCNFIWAYKHRASLSAKTTPMTTTMSIMVLPLRKVQNHRKQKRQ